MQPALSKFICLAFVLSAAAVSQTESDSPELADVRLWLDRSTRTGDSVEWANDLMQADAAAEKLEQDKPGGCCWVRCIRVGTFTLHYHFSDLAGREFYQHDLLQLIAADHMGSKDGADALVRLLPTGCETMSTQWIPLFRTVLGILEQKRWKDLADIRLTEIRGEAYETWWSLARMSEKDPLVTDSEMSPTDFADGAALARDRAIECYQTLVKAHRATADVIHRLAKLKANQDTEMRKWVCYGD